MRSSHRAPIMCVNETEVLPRLMSTRGATRGKPMSSTADLRVGLLTGGDDRSYALGLTASLVAQGVQVDFIGSDKLDAPELHGNAVGDLSESAGGPARGCRLCPERRSGCRRTTFVS